MFTKFQFTLFILLFTVLSVNAETVKDISVELTATVSNNPPKITLNWVANTGTYSYKIYRKEKESNAWGSEIASIPGTATQYVDYSVVKNIAYEYKVLRIRNSGVKGYGYILAGIEIPATDKRDKLVLLVDNSFTTSLNAEIKQLITDLEGDGWEVLRHDVSRNAPVSSIKNIIVNDYVTKNNVKAVYLLGHIPVPYSGEIYPDGHTNHQGAWPSDVYYADMDGLWTDQYVNNTNSAFSSNRNIPGDGKFDQSFIPSDLELQIGRVDLSNMSFFGNNEQTVLKNYLDKAHQYKTKQTTSINQAIIDDNLGYFSGEAFAACAYRNFAALCHPNSVYAGDYFPAMTGTSYRWSFGCGGGSNISANGVGTSSNFASAYLDGTFTMLYGSYFGDWNNSNNFLRAPLCQGKILTSVWCGRPMWQFHQMALGENIGYSVLKNQNSDSLYYMNYGGKFVHYALMGDPSLRADYIAPVPGVVASMNGGICHISWASSSDNVIGYNVYAKNEGNSAFTKLNSQPIIGNSYVDSCAVYPGVYTYMVRAISLQNTPSGSYYNLSLGVIDTAYSSNDLTFNSTVNFTVNGNQVTFDAFTNGVNNYQWNFGDGGYSLLYNPIHDFDDGNHYIQLTLANECFSESKEIALSIGSNNAPLKPTHLAFSNNVACAGTSFIASVDEVPGVEYSWTYSGSGVSFSDSSAHPTVSIGDNASSGTITVTPLNAYGNGLSVSKFLTILPKPDVHITGNLSICSGSNTNLLAEGADTYYWANGTTNANVIVNPTVSSSVYVIGSSINGCKDTAFAYVTVNPNPIANLISSIPSNTFCFGTSVTFTVTSGYENYQFKNGNTSVQNDTIPTYSSTQLLNGSQLKAIVTNSFGCTTTTNTITNTVTNTIGAPTISILSGANPFCFGDSIILQSSYSTGNHWSNGSTAQTIRVDSTSSVGLFYSSNGCSSNTVYFNATEKQKVESHISGTTTTCANSTQLSANLIANYGPNLTYQWKGPDNSVVNALTKTATQNGKYTLHIIPSDGCSSTIDSVIVTLGNLTKPTLNISDSISFCQGDSTLLTSSIVSNIHWSNGLTTSSIYVKTSGDYFVTVSNNNCALNSDTVKVRVIERLSPPFISALGPTTFCDGYSVLLTGNSNGKWSDDLTASNTKEVFASGTYQVFVTNACGTTYSNSIAVTVLPQPIAPIIYPNGNTKICENQTVTLSGNTNGVWNDNTLASSPSITVGNAGVYFVTTTNSCGSSFSNSIQVLGLNDVNIQIFPVGNQNLCNNTGRVILAGNTAGYWNIGGSNYSIEIVDTGSYYISQTTICGVQNSNVIHVGNDNYPILSDIFTNDSISFCPGDSALLEGNLQGLWSIQNSYAPFIYAKSSGDYFVKNTNACGTVYSDTIHIQTFKAPNNPQNTTGFTMCQGYQLQAGEGLKSKLDTVTAIYQKTFAIELTVPTSDVGSIIPSFQIASYVLPYNLDLSPKERLIDAYLELKSITMNVPDQFDDVVITANGSINFNQIQNVIVTPIDNNTFSLKIPINRTLIDEQGGLLKLFYTERSNEDSNGPDCNLPLEAKLVINYKVASEFSWYATPSPLDSISSDTLFNPYPGTSTYSSQYFYAANKLGGCYSEFVPVLLDVKTPLTPPTLVNIGNSALCNGDSTTIIGNSNFFWNTENTTKDSLKVTSAGTYFVSDSNACGTVNSNQIVISTASGNAPTIDISLVNDPAQLCNGDLIQFNASSTNEGSNPTFKWYRNGFQFAQNSSTIISPSIQDNDLIFCQLTSSSDCVSNPITYSDTIQVHLQAKGTWIATSNDSWNISTNWCGGIPTATTDVSIGNASMIVPKLQGESFCKDLNIAPSSSLHLNNQTLQIFGSINNTGKIKGSENSSLKFYGSQNAGTLFLDQSNSSSKSLQKLIVSKTAGNISMGDTIRIIEELQMNDGNLVTNDLVVLVSNASTNARIAPIIGDASITGKIIAQRFIPQGLTGWVMLSNPIQHDSIIDWMDDFATSGFTGATGSVGNFVSIYSYDESISGYADNGFTAPTDSSDVIQLGKGYYAYVGTSSINSNDITVDAKGEAFIGDFNFPITYTASIPSELVNEDGWNLIANPYCSAINWDDTHWIKSNVGDAIYSYNTDAQQYTSYANGIGINGGSSTIEASQGFWIKANAQNPMLVANEFVKTNSNNFFFKSNTQTNLPANSFKIKLETTEGKDETVIRFLPGTTEHFDAQVDAVKKISSNPKVPCIATRSANEIYAINNFNEVASNELPIYLRVFKPGMLTFTCTGIGNLNNEVALRDNSNGFEIPIQSDTTFQILVIDTTQIANRYSLVWASPSITTTVQLAPSKQSCTVSPNPAHGDEIFLRHLPNACTIHFINAVGEIVLSNTSQFDAQKINVATLANGSYIIQVKSIDGKIYNLHWIK